MSKTIYNADYSECLPEALKKDHKMVALANATAAALLDTSGIMNQHWAAYFQKVKWKNGSSMRENPDTFTLF